MFLKVFCFNLTDRSFAKTPRFGIGCYSHEIFRDPEEPETKFALQPDQIHRSARPDPPPSETSMVTTRSQTAAARAGSQNAVQATMQNQQGSDVVTATVEVSDDNILATTAPTAIQLVPGAESCLANLAERFLAQVQVLAGENVILKYQQEGLNQAQQAAIVAVLGYAESGLKELASRQLVMVHEFQRELAPNRSALQQQILLLQKRETQSVLQSYAKRAKQLGQTVHFKFGASFKKMTAHMQQQIAEQLTSRLGTNPSKDGEQLVDKSTTAMEARIGTLLEDRLNELLASKFNSRNNDKINKSVDGLVHKHIDTSISNLKLRLEQSFDLRLKHFREEMQRQLNSNHTVHDTFNEDIQQMVTQQTTRLVRQAEL
ncbi:unnamed protein product [Phytophthora fragariaefolia]|uniref:Unnamed protein product n=1 Tax=Phytophthora fragariaefolia TaxID=1490495 RepID=A0A9W6XC76_9STRA|nr:unnamed protein product [Phytophthora fragariaefolia]